MKRRKPTRYVIPTQLPLPWRAVDPLTRVLLSFGIRPTSKIARSDGTPDFRLIALGDLAFTRKPENGYAAFLAGLNPILAEAHLISANLEAMFTMRTECVGEIGSHLRADPQAVAAFQRDSRVVLSLANNHSLDFGPHAIVDTIEILDRSGIASCGHDDKTDTHHDPTLEVESRRIATLGFCDDHIPIPEEWAGPRPMQLVPELVEVAVTRAAKVADLVIVNLHWGYEFSLHPLLTHRDFARRVIEWGADVVLCHHAHVPMGIEHWQKGLIAHGLGNCVMPQSSYQSQGHPWTRCSFALELGWRGSTIVQTKVHPFVIDAEGKPRPAAKREAETLLRGIEALSSRLDDTDFLSRMERYRLTTEAASLIDAIYEAAQHSEAALLERLATTKLPRQRMLLAFMDSEDGFGAASHELRSLMHEIDSEPSRLAQRQATRRIAPFRELASRSKSRTTNAMRLAARVP